jgi:hypothetical protein
MLTAQTCKTDPVGVPGVDDMTVSTVQDLSISDWGFEISDWSEKKPSKITNPQSQIPNAITLNPEPFTE